MISLKPILFFSLLELLMALAIGTSVLFWKWRRLKKEKQVMVKLWHDAKDSTKANLDELEHQCETGGTSVARKRECFNALKAMFDQEMMTGLGQWGRSSEAIMLALGQMERESEESKAKNLVTEPKSEFVQPEVDDYQEMESFVAEQNQPFIELLQYKSELADMISKFNQINAGHHNLLEGPKNVVSTDEKPHALLDTHDTLQQYKQEMRSMIMELELESNQIVLKVKALEMQNQQLMDSLNSYRKDMGNNSLNRIDLTGEKDKLEKKLQMRDKSINRLYHKYEALRREYILLYELSTKGKKPNLPPMAE